MDVFDYLIYAALAAVSLVLAAGIYSLFRGGDFGRSSPMERRPATAGAGAGGSRRDDLDDDIPF